MIFLVKFDLESDLKCEIYDGKNLVKLWGRTFLPTRKAQEISGRISGQFSGQISEKHFGIPFQSSPRFSFSRRAFLTIRDENITAVCDRLCTFTLFSGHLAASILGSPDRPGAFQERSHACAVVLERICKGLKHGHGDVRLSPPAAAEAKVHPKQSPPLTKSTKGAPSSLKLVSLCRKWGFKRWGLRKSEDIRGKGLFPPFLKFPSAVRGPPERGEKREKWRKRPISGFGVRKRGVEFKAGKLHDRFGGFGGSGEHLTLLLLVLQNTAQ